MRMVRLKNELNAMKEAEEEAEAEKEAIAELKNTSVRQLITEAESEKE